MRCGECHQLEFAAWKETAHQRGFVAMHRLPAAKTIAKKLGIKRIKRDPSCVACHYTPAPDVATLKPTSGVSCESCHAPGRDWVDAHATYGGPQATAETETDEHKATRRDQSLAAGMNAPFRVADLARRCFDCHTIADQRLVESGGHPAASAGFELVAWLEGEVRHNYFFSPDKRNRVATSERKRVLFVVGRGLALESGLRAWSSSRSDGRYLTAMTSLVAESKSALEVIAERTEIAEVTEMLASVEELSPISARLEPDEMLSTAADRVASAVRAFAARSDGSDLAALDELLPPASDFRGHALP